jgi:hypothetical protein
MVWLPKLNVPGFTLMIGKIVCAVKLATRFLLLDIVNIKGLVELVASPLHPVNV